MCCLFCCSVLCHFAPRSTSSAPCGPRLLFHWHNIVTRLESDYLSECFCIGNGLGALGAPSQALVLLTMGESACSNYRLV